MDMPDQQSQNAYIEAVVSQAKAEVCSAHLSGFRAEFERRFTAWQVANAAVISRGKELLEQQANERKPTGQDFASMNAQVLASLPADG